MSPRRLSPLLAVLTAALVPVTAATAYFGSAGIGTAAAGVTTLSAPGDSAASASGASATVTWAAATITPSVAADSYTVERYSASGGDLGPASCGTVTASAGRPDAFGTFSCADAPAAGTVHYVVTAHFGSWSAAGAATPNVTVVNATSTTATAPGAGTTGTAIAAASITATLSGAGPAASGSITFSVFGPQASAPVACTTGGTTIGTATVSANGSYHPAAAYTPTTAGTYWLFAGYGGDPADGASASACGAGMASIDVNNSPSVTAAGPAGATTNAAIATSAISAVLSGAAPGVAGTITFRVFGPQVSAPTTCTTGGTTVGTATVSANGTYHPSATYTPTSAGTYWWYASFGGDANDNAAASPCGNGMASTPVSNATALATAAPGTDTTSATIATSAISTTLTGATTGAGGTITYKVFGPQATAPTSCTSAGATVGTATVSGGATYHPSAGFTPSAPGDYWWYASYSGDASNTASASPCGSSMAETVVWTATALATTGTVTANSTTAATASFTVAPSTTYVLFVSRQSIAADAISSIASSGLTPALSLASFTVLKAQVHNAVSYEWAYVITTASTASGSGTLTVTFGKALPSGGDSIVALVALAGNSLATPSVSGHNAVASGSSAVATANLGGAPAARNAELVMLTGSASLGAAAPAASGVTALASGYFASPNGSMALYSAIPAQTATTFSGLPSQAWGTLALELNHG